MEELVKCIKGCKNNQATGLNNIPIEVWKTGALNTQLLEVCNKTFNGDRLDIWVKSGIIPIPKKGDLGLTTNYPGISLSVTAATIYNKDKYSGYTQDKSKWLSCWTVNTIRNSDTEKTNRGHKR